MADEQDEQQDPSMVRISSVSALKARFSVGGSSSPTSPGGSITPVRDDISKSDLIRSEITKQRRLSVKDMANKFKDPSTMIEEQRQETISLHAPDMLERSQSASK